MSEWISVNDRLPSDTQGLTGIIIGRNKGAISSMNGAYFEDQFYCLTLGGMMPAVNITHWMPLPEPPTTED